MTNETTGGAPLPHYDSRAASTAVASPVAPPGAQEAVHSLLDELRALGLTVAVHNDYRLNGEAHTFWLFTDAAGMSYKGEGKTDHEALTRVAMSAGRTLYTAPVPATTPVEQPEGVGLVPNWAGEFKSFEQWVAKGQSWLKSPAHIPVICVDALGRRCTLGADMRRARDENAFPVRYFWDCATATNTNPKDEA